MKKTLEIPVADLKTAVAGFAKVIIRSPLPALGCVRVSSETGCVFLQATDLDSFVSCRMAAAAAERFEPVLIPFDKLSRQVKGMNTKDRLGIVVSDKEVAFAYDLGGTRVEQPIETVDPKEWPPAPVIENPEFPVGPNFKTALKEAHECASDDSSRYVLNGAFLDVLQPESHYLVGTDGRTLYSANTFRFEISESVILPRRKFLQWGGFVDDGDWTLAVRPPVLPLAPPPAPETKTGGAPATPADTRPGNQPVKSEFGWARIKSARWTLTTRLIDGLAPNWRQVVPPMDIFKTGVKLGESAISVLQTVIPRLPGYDGSTEAVHLEMRPGSFLVRGFDRNSQKWTDVPIPGAEVTGEPNEITVNRNYLLKALRFGLNQLVVESALTPMVLWEGGRKFVLMPMRFEGAKPPAATPKDNHPPTEAAQSAPPSAETPKITTEETTPAMPTPNKPNEPTPPAKPATPPAAAPVATPAQTPTPAPEPEENPSPFKAAIAEIDTAKEGLRAIITSMNGVIGLLRSAEREQKAANREIDAVRNKLREIQSVKL
jgi:hypothetical protein